MAEEDGFWNLPGQVTDDKLLRALLRIKIDETDRKTSGCRPDDPTKERDKFSSLSIFWISDLFILSALLGGHLSNAGQE